MQLAGVYFVADAVITDVVRTGLKDTPEHCWCVIPFHTILNYRLIWLVAPSNFRERAVGARWMYMQLSLMATNPLETAFLSFRFQFPC